MKKLIEVALPLEAINEASAREKSIRHGHPSTLHLWWARRPLAAARAVIWASLVDDPSSHPEEFPTEEAQNKERQRLFKILEKLVVWENSNNQEVLNAAKAEILKSTGGNPPPLLDPFAGGGAIPLEAQRLGLEAHASDLNPVAVMINKAMIEIPPKFANMPPVNPETRRRMSTASDWPGASGLAEDVRYYGEWMKKEAFKRIGHLYPKVKDVHGHEHTVIAWIWTRTVKCPNPVCGCEMPLASSFELSKKKGKEAYVQPIIEGKRIIYKVKYGKNAPEAPKSGRGQFRCICCNSPVESSYIKEEGKAKRFGINLMAVVVEANGGRVYLTPNAEQTEAIKHVEPNWIPDGKLVGKSADQLPLYGYSSFSELFTKRQLTTLVTFNDLVLEAQVKVVADGGNEEYAQAISVYLALAISKMTNIDNALIPWSVTRDQAVQLFSRQAISMTWDFAENNVFNNSAGDFLVSLGGICKVLDSFTCSNYGYANQHDAQTDNGLRSIIISTDPPYYDNICYADLSDFFYIWLRQSLKTQYPDLFRTMLVPKADELIASQYRFRGDRNQACAFFENGMLKAFNQISIYAHSDFPVTVYYAYKQSENDGNNTSSTGWETMLSAIIQAGFSITGTWPIRSERPTGLKVAVNALASSIVLVCRKRSENAHVCTRRDFINTLKRELKPALLNLQISNIAPVDLAQTAIGPGMAVFSKYSKVLESDGSAMSVRSALQLINQELDSFYTEQEGDLDRDSRFCVELYSQYAFNNIKFGEADVLARAKNTSVEKLAGKGILTAQKGVVYLLPREELPKEVDKAESVIWLLTQQLTYAMETGGVKACAEIVAPMLGSNAEYAKALAYRLFTIAERKSWAGEAFAYNSLVIAWPEIQSKAAEINGAKPEQLKLF